MGNTVLVNGLLREVPRATDRVSPQAVIKAGPTNFQRLTVDPTVLRALKYSYSKAIQNILYFSLATIAVSVPFAIGMEWKNLKTAVKEKQAQMDLSNGASQDERVASS